MPKRARKRKGPPGTPEGYKSIRSFFNNHENQNPAPSELPRPVVDLADSPTEPHRPPLSPIKRPKLQNTPTSSPLGRVSSPIKSTTSTPERRPTRTAPTVTPRQAQAIAANLSAIFIGQAEPTTVKPPVLKRGDTPPSQFVSDMLRAYNYGGTDIIAVTETLKPINGETGYHVPTSALFSPHPHPWFQVEGFALQHEGLQTQGVVVHIKPYQQKRFKRQELTQYFRHSIETENGNTRIGKYIFAKLTQNQTLIVDLSATEPPSVFENPLEQAKRQLKDALKEAGLPAGIKERHFNVVFVHHTAGKKDSMQLSNVFDVRYDGFNVYMHEAYMHFSPAPSNGASPENSNPAPPPVSVPLEFKQ